MAVPTKWVKGGNIVIKINQNRLKEINANTIRKRRDQLLAASDWAMVSDAATDKDEWRIYRQALRDITTQNKFPNSVDWPVSPSQ